MFFLLASANLKSDSDSCDDDDGGYGGGDGCLIVMTFQVSHVPHYPFMFVVTYCSETPINPAFPIHHSFVATNHGTSL